MKAVVVCCGLGPIVPEQQRLTLAAKAKIKPTRKRNPAVAGNAISSVPAISRWLCTAVAQQSTAWGQSW